MQDGLAEQQQPPVELPEAQKRAVTIFGRTDDPFEASFVLTDGTLLYSRNYEGVALDHNAITRQILPDSTRCESEFNDTGAIRVKKYLPQEEDRNVAHLYIELSQNPTPEQVRTLKKLTEDTRMVRFAWFLPGVNRHDYSEYSDKHIHAESEGVYHVSALVQFLHKVRRSNASGTGGSYSK